MIASKHFFLLFLVYVLKASAQESIIGGKIENESLIIRSPNVIVDDGETSVCGKIENEQLSIPSYKFIVTDKNGQVVENFRAAGRLVITEGTWVGSWFDGYWIEESHNLSIPITYDSKEGVYISQEVPKVKIAQRQKGFPPKKCWDRVRQLLFLFNSDFQLKTSNKNWKVGVFNFELAYKKINELSLPDSSTIIKVVLLY